MYTLKEHKKETKKWVYCKSIRWPILQFTKHHRWGLTIDIGYSWVWDCFRILVIIGKWGFIVRYLYFYEFQYYLKNNFKGITKLWTLKKYQRG